MEDQLYVCEVLICKFLFFVLKCKMYIKLCTVHNLITVLNTELTLKIPLVSYYGGKMYIIYHGYTEFSGVVVLDFVLKFHSRSLCAPA